MKLAQKLQLWTDKGFITKKQAATILASEQARTHGLAFYALFGLAAFFIGLGLILIIGANWREIPAPIKLLADFALLSGFIYGAYVNILKQKKGLKELFLILSYLMIGGTIGLIAQVFHLSGGFESFLKGWTLLGLPFVLMSKSFLFNLVWVWMFGAGCFDWIAAFLEFIEPIVGPLIDALHDYPALLTMLGTGLFFSFFFLAQKLYMALKKVILLPKALSLLFKVSMYAVAIIGGFNSGFFGHCFALAFLSVGAWRAVRLADMRHFKHHIFGIELYAFVLFMTEMHGLFMSGLGFILAGLMVLGFIYLLKKTSRYINQMEENA